MHSPSALNRAPLRWLRYDMIAASRLPTRSIFASHSTRSSGMSKSLNFKDVLPTLLTSSFITVPSHV